MSQPACALAWPDLEQDAAAFDRAATAREAQRLAELAGAFALFGLRITLDQADDCQVDDCQAESAETPFRAATAAASPPANDRAADARPRFPELRRRGMHVDPALPLQLIQALDWALVLLAAECAALWGAGTSLAQLPFGQAAAFVASASALKVGLWLTESYHPPAARIEVGFGGLALGAILGIIAANLLAPDARSAAALGAILPLAALAVAGVHAALGLWTTAAHRAGVFAENIVLVGATAAARRMAERAAASGEARVVAIIDDRRSRAPGFVSGAPVPGGVDELIAWEGLPYVDRIVVTVTQKAEVRVRAILHKMRALPNRVDLLLDYEVESVRGRRVDRLTGAAVACIAGRPQTGSRALIKRAQDLILGSLLLALFAAPMCAIALAVKLDSKGPVFYRQRRHGFNNRTITIAKFRTMRHAPGAPLRQVVAGDTRITRIGKFLRRTSLDELPQLFNVLAGDMSLVGPRPHAIGMKAADRDLDHIVAEYAHRHRVKPGLTGWAQVNGSRGPLRTPACVRRRLHLDLDYVARASLWLDLQILARTAPVLFADRKATR